MYIANRSGAKCDPCGTPAVICDGDDSALSTHTCIVRLLR